MSTYFDFTVERKYKDEWVCIAKSNYDDDLDVINPWILKGAFWDADFSEDINCLNEKFSNETFYNFSHKTNEYFHREKNNYDINKSNFVLNHHSTDIINFLKEYSKTKYKCNDVCFWFDLEYICKNKDFLRAYLLNNKNTELNDSLEFLNKIDSANEVSEFKKLFKECNNVIINGDKIAIIFNESPYCMIENIKYNPLFKNIKIDMVNLMLYYEDDNVTEKKTV